jgi:predicted membrane metal-binding protein
MTEVTTLAAVLELVVGVAHHAAYQSFSLPVLCYLLSAVLILNPLWVVTGE